MNTMADASNVRTLRLVGSLVSAGAALLLCANLRHFCPTFAEPSSFLFALHHRCGWALIIAFTWALLESGLYLGQFWRSARVG